MRYRWLVVARSSASLAFAAAGCGGSDDGGGGAEGSEDVTRIDLDHGDLGRRGAEVVPGRDRRLQRAVPERHGQVHVRRRQPRAAALDRDRRRQPARHRRDRPAGPDGGLRGAGRDQVDRRPARQDRRQLRRGRRGRRAPSTGRSTRSCSRARTNRPSGTTSRRSTRPASSRRRPGTTSTRSATRCKAAGITPYSVGVDVGWPITDLFENIYLRPRAPRSTTSSRSTRSRGPTSP